MNKALDLRFGDLIIDASCLFASRNGQTIQFTRNERALLLALTRNPNRLMRRGRLLDEIASESDVSDRNIDFLVNRLRAKLGDSAKAPKYIATQYGEGYVWIATPSPVAPIEALLVIGSAFGPQGHPFSQQASSLVDRLRDLIAAGVGVGHKIVVAENWRPAAADKLRYVLQMSFLAGNEQLDCAATLREMPSKRIVKAFRLQLDMADSASFTAEASRVSNGVIDALSQALIEASTGLGTPVDEPLETRLHIAASLLSTSNRWWLANGEQLGRNREQDPLNADIALQWCLHLFARLVHTSPFGETSLEERYRIESEIDATVLECLPAVETNPLLMLAAAKLLYFINRGHLELAEDIAERAFARTADFAAALPIMGQLRYARGRFDEAAGFFDRGIEMFEPDSDLHLHMRVLKAISVLASGDRASLDTAVADAAREAPRCPRDIGLTIGWMIASPDQKLSAASADALAAIGPAGASNAIEYLYFTSARHLVSEQARANVMRGLIAHVTRLHGVQAVPAFVLRNIGSTAAG
ncbi:winged helix-turn-helix domain-containing protein [Bradyrhizobium sp. CNPSo 4010]|uniref:Winged helix-turn-helix domain-containing protein n=1 Tax=Bradyrhizobium agreste TaxID=2751811 RepID=A0ABS0PI07_9BRAD|nr:helix-turn-helix domain-containing protein [Bradyrhizobium agreste]MBH5396838.1 winged helix-turn-helix domain-containing protein [Bradyrhizobium agreste]